MHSLSRVALELAALVLPALAFTPGQAPAPQKWPAPARRLDLHGDPLPPGQLAFQAGKRPANPGPGAPGGIVLPGSTGPESDPCNALRYSPDGKELFVHGDTRLSSFDAATGARLRKVNLPAEPHCFSA